MLMITMKTQVRFGAGEARRGEMSTGFSCWFRSENVWTKQLTLSNPVSLSTGEFHCKGLARPTHRGGLGPWLKKKLNVCLRFHQGLCLIEGPNVAETKCWAIPEEEIHSFWALEPEDV